MCCRLHVELLLGNSPNLELDTHPKPPVTAVPAQDQGPLGPSPGTFPGLNAALWQTRVCPVERVPALAFAHAHPLPRVPPASRCPLQTGNQQGLG